MNEEKLFLGIYPLEEAKRIKRSMASHNVALELMTNPETCASGSCKVTVELWGNETDKDKIIEHFRAERLKDLDGLDLNLENLNQVFDEDSPTTVCQACGTSFATNAKECPDCGLVYG